ncbi:MAG: hypothetical protein HRU80_00785 [Ignavibacteriales bacterium]|nr:MAG: hypothetical protein HRU80_00785 [Ignavibacteriales bacterium]
MEKKVYTARKVKPAGREGWVLEYRHPLLIDSKGKKGKKVRKGLSTRDEQTAEILTQQMNALLSDEFYWDINSKTNALAQFDKGIVESFYSEIEYILCDYRKKREEIIPLKTKIDGYSTVLLLGQTGAGKTTLLRQMIGTDPIKEKFPATSTAKTTIFDTEIILANGPYLGVVTFFTESETREFIKESIRNAIKKFLSTDNRNDTLRIFLEDEDQRFRLSYVLGKIKERKKYSNYEYVEPIESNDIGITESEQLEIEIKLKDYLDRIVNLTKKIIDSTKADLAAESNLSDEDQLIVEEIIESAISEYEEDDFIELVEDIVEEIKKRFTLLDQNQLKREKFGWPIYWRLETTDRSEFINALKFFSSNSSKLFGKLLTPLVSGIRTQGPFKPDFLERIPKLVILDGEGMGHIPNTAANLPSNVIENFDNSDAIILVDNAQNSMLASPYAVIKSTAISGHYRKLVVCFTHFDSVSGDNLPTLDDKIDHINGSVDNLLGKLENELGYEVKKYLTNHFANNSYYLGNLDKKITTEFQFKFTRDQLFNLINSLELMNVAPEFGPVTLEYDISTLVFKIRSAVIKFHNKWDGFLFGTNEIPGINKQHFSRIKALSQRLGQTWMDHYDTLKPISDLWDSFSEQISGFLNSPDDWRPSNVSEEVRIEKTNEIKRKISQKLLEFARISLKESVVTEWQVAFEFSGRGSATLRAKKVDSILDNVVPPAIDDTSEASKKFLKVIMNIIVESIEECGGKTTSIFVK